MDEEGASFFDPTANEPVSNHGGSTSASKKDTGAGAKPARKAAPQVVPQMDSAEAFPSMTNGASAPAPVRMNGAWGTR